MNKFEVFKLGFYASKFGHMSSDEALLIAIDAEQFAKSVGPFDVAYEHFIKQRNDFEAYALLLEKERFTDASK